MLQLSNFPARLKERRKSLKLTQTQLAEKTNKTQTSINDYENSRGRSGVPNLQADTIIKLLDALNCDFEYLFGDNESPVSKTHEYIESVTGLSSAAVDRLIMIKAVGLSGVLSALLESDKITDALRSIETAKAVRVPDVVSFERSIKKDISNYEITEDPKRNSIYDNMAITASKLSPCYTLLTRGDASTHHLRDAQDAFFEIAKEYTLTEGKE